MGRRLTPMLAAVAAIVLVVLLVHDRGHPSSSATNSRPPSSTRTTLVATSMSPGLPAPISGESVVASANGLLILGGLDSASASVSGVFRMDTATGQLHPAGALTGPLHDAAAAALADRVLVIGGGSATSSDTVQSLPAPGGSDAASAGSTVVGHLPTVRSDLSAVTVGREAYVLGGYDGQAPIDSVLQTADGTSFSQTAALPSPARYMAAIALAGKIYAFGGETAGGGASDAIQEVDPQRGSARVIGHLPEAVSHASAVALGGRVFILGGDLNGTASDRIWRFDPVTRKASPTGRLPVAVSDGAAATVGSSAYLVGGTGASGAALRTVIALNLKHKVVATPATATPPAQRAAPSRRAAPFAGRLLIADRGNNRLIVVDSHKRVLWRYPSRNHPAPRGGFYFPDDAFFTHGGTGIISNEEQNERIVQIAYPSGKLRWSYGHPGIAGSSAGYLHEPDDAFLWRDGTVSVADAQNCRVLIVTRAKKVLRQFGSSASCSHDPPRYLGSPNGDTPLADGNLLISEVNGSYIDEITRTGKLVWSVQLPIAYPSDPQQLGSDRYLVADYTTPGGIYEFNRRGKVLWSYHPTSGHGMLDHPSLAERLPGGDIAANDDYRHRVVIIDPRARRIVWQYGRTDNAGRGPNHLNTPDGFDLLAPNGVTPTHPSTG